MVSPTSSSASPAQASPSRPAPTEKTCTSPSACPSGPAKPRTSPAPVAQHHRPRKARVILYDVAQEQVEPTIPAEHPLLGLALDAISRDPGIGTASKHAAFREYRSTSVRILYVSTALGTLVLIAYVEPG